MVPISVARFFHKRFGSFRYPDPGASAFPESSLWEWVTGLFAHGQFGRLEKTPAIRRIAVREADVSQHHGGPIQDPQKLLGS